MGGVLHSSTKHRFAWLRCRLHLVASMVGMMWSCEGRALEVQAWCARLVRFELPVGAAECSQAQRCFAAHLRRCRWARCGWR